MNLILTSDFPASAPAPVVDRIKAAAAAPRVAWIPAATDRNRTAFEAASRDLRALGAGEVEYCDVDEEADPVQLAFLHEFDVICLGGGDAVRFRFNLLRTGAAGRLRQAATSGRLIVASGGAAMLLTPNVSIARLRADGLEAVIADRGRYDALGAVGYEVLPHANRFDPPFLDRVRAYSARIPHDVVAIPDGAALMPTARDQFDAIGEVFVFRNGVRCDNP